jgi:glycerophosphoryl diester phosphodiesterase
VARAASGDPSLSIGLLVHPLAPALPAVSEAASLGATVLLPPWPHADAAVVAEAHGAGLAVVPWTANGQSALGALAAAGVDGVVTDDVAGTLAWRAARA